MTDPKATIGKWKDVLENRKADDKDELLVAVADGELPEIERLFAELKADRSAEALIAAVRMEATTEVVSLLLEQRASPSLSDRHGWTPLVVAAAKGNPDLVRCLLDHRAQAHSDPETGEGEKRVVTPLHAAASFASLKTPVKTDKEKGETIAYHFAYNFVRVASILLQNRADPNVELQWEGHRSTCLLAAASSEAPYSYALDMIHLLLMQRADPKITIEDRTVLSVAAEGRAEYLLEDLLRGEGEEYTDLVQSLLQEVKPAQGYTRQPQRLQEPVRTILGRGNIEQVQKKQWSERGCDWDLELQNLRYAPTVQVSLRSLRIRASVACDPRVLNAVAQAANDETLASDTVEVITTAAWLQWRAVTAIDVCLDAVAIACLCSVTISCRAGGDMKARLSFAVLILIQVKEATEWIVHFFYLSRGVFGLLLKQYVFFEPVKGEDWHESVSGQGAGVLETFADLLFLVVGCAAIASQMELCNEERMDKVWMPWFCSMYWLRFVYSLRGERWLGIYLLPILSAVRDTWAFFFVTFLCVGGATHAYIILDPRGGDPLPIYSALTHTVRLAIFGDFDLFEYQGQDTTFELNTESNEWQPKDPSPRDLGSDGSDWIWSYAYLQLSFFITGIGITVLLMNLLIGILGHNYDAHQDRAQVLLVQARARMLQEQQRRPWSRAFTWLKGRLKPEETSPDTDRLAKMTTKELEHEFFNPARLPRQYRYPAIVGIVLLSSLRTIMGKDVFDHFLAGAVYRPVVQNRSLAFVILILCPLLLVLSLVIWVTFWPLCLLFRIQGVRYELNLAVFGIFHTNFASECHILALVRREDGKTDLKERIEKLEDLVKACSVTL
ncbi:psmD10 [Symbiodinium sp. CCMP2592]|nr:psmD10 [Symbiodinium sp. CCMP2592]